MRHISGGRVITTDSPSHDFAAFTTPRQAGAGWPRTYGRRTLAADSGWAARNGAHRLYLQVETDNEVARVVDTRAGFAWSHGYHYRIAP